MNAIRIQPHQPSSSSSSTTSEQPDMSADDFYFAALHDDEAPIFPISDEKYAFQLHLQDALLTSFSASLVPTVQSNKFSQKQKLKSAAIDSSSSPPPTATGSTTTCPICGDSKRPVDFFKTSCTHSYCTDCISAYIAVKMQENIFSVRCPDPGCQTALDPQACRGIVPRQVLDRWEDALCESLILAAQKFYCPFKDCSAVMVDDGGEEVTAAECPSCWRLFCARCRVAWHAGLDCSEFQRVKNMDETERKSEALVAKLAKSKRWTRCPNCKFYVERTQGCFHIHCRCGYNFCHGCGSRWSTSHHVCSLW